jgi:predicted nucleic-acid-binding Zn-ribbon protein
MKTFECPKCGRQQARGFVLDRRRVRKFDTSKWVKGEPRRSFWHGLDLKGRDIYTIQAQRCDSCGFVELYAPATPDQS